MLCTDKNTNSFNFQSSMPNIVYSLQNVSKETDLNFAKRDNNQQKPVVGFFPDTLIRHCLAIIVIIMILMFHNGPCSLRKPPAGL